MDDAERLPCLATLAPHAAATTDAHADASTPNLQAIIAALQHYTSIPPSTWSAPVAVIT